MIAADTNLLARAILDDDPIQSPLAKDRLQAASEIFISPIVLCELAWVLDRKKWDRTQIENTLRILVSAANIRVDTLSVQAGLSFLQRGGDFSDGVILQQAWTNGCEEVLTFDQDFARLGTPTVTLVA